MQYRFHIAVHIKMSVTGKSSIWRILFLTIIYFFYFYGFRIPGLPPSLSYYRLAAVLLFLYTCVASNKAAGFGNTQTSRMVKKYLWWNVFLLIYVGFILLTFGPGNGLSALPSYVNMLFILPLFFISGKYVFRNIEELMTILYIGCIIQAVIIIFATFIPSLETALKYIYIGTVEDVDRLETTERMIMSGYHMGFQCFTSQGSLKMAIGGIGACYFLMKSTGRKFLMHLMLFVLITFATSLLSRTGLFISISCLFIVFLNRQKQGSKRFATSFFIVLVVFLIGSFIVDNFTSNKYLNENFGRMSTLFSNGIMDTYFNEWMGEGEGGNVVPPISSYTLWGLGIRKGISGAGIETTVDGGFLINYSSMGLIMAIINYLIVFSFYSKQYHFTKNSVFKSLVIILFIILIMGEIKEHFIYQLHYMCIMFVTFYLMEKEENRSIICQ